MRLMSREMIFELTTEETAKMVESFLLEKTFIKHIAVKKIELTPNNTLMVQAEVEG